MTYAHLSRLLFTSLALAVASCGDKPPVDTDGSTGAATDSAGSTGTSSTGSAASSSGDAPTTGADPTGNTGTDTSGDPTGDPTSGSGSTTTGEPGSSSSGGGSGSTTDGLECTLMDQACAAAEQGGLFEDCGLVLLADPVEAWQTAQDCALTAIAELRGFKLITELQGIDSEVAMAYVGIDAPEEYLVEVFFFDGDPCGGGGCGPKISRTICGESVIATQDCVVEPGNICLTCEAAGDSLDVCEGD